MGERVVGVVHPLHEGQARQTRPAATRRGQGEVLQLGPSAEAADVLINGLTVGMRYKVIVMTVSLYQTLILLYTLARVYLFCRAELRGAAAN